VVSRIAPWFLLALIVSWTTMLRLRLIAAGPDPDIDAYLHFHIGMRLVSEHVGLEGHWVWLPLWHFVDAAVFALGGGIVVVRYLSVAFTAATAFVLTGLLRHHLTAHPAEAPWLVAAERMIPFVAGASFALWPLNLRGGASAEPEAFFQLVLVLAAFAWQARRPLAAGFALSVAVMLRYEAWPLVAAFAGLWWFGGRGLRAAFAWVLPAGVVALWCVVHRVGTGEWLRFVRDNHTYVDEAWREFRIAEQPLLRVRLAPLWYGVLLPAEALRRWAVWLVPGVVWLLRRGPKALVVSSAMLLATVTMVWVTRRNLGLERHFAALIPAYATMAAAGLVVAVAYVAERLGARFLRAAVGVALVVTLQGFVRWRTASAVASYQRAATLAHRSERAVADILRRQSLPDATVFSQNAAVTVFAGLPLSRYVDRDPARLRDVDLLVESVHHGEVWVVARPDQTTALHEGIEVMHRDGTLMLLRRRAPAHVDRALLRRRPRR